jgi:tetratricopeptide (TPR) repeat protein/tRNA A-37 threonylcarbamoyl transferase component Bud32
MNERELFIEAIQRSDPAERAAYLELTVAGNAALRRRIEMLLAADNEAGEVLKEPAPADTATTLSEISAPAPGTELAPSVDDPSSISTLPFEEEPDEAEEPATEVDTGVDPPSTLEPVADPGETPLPATERATSNGNGRQRTPEVAREPARAPAIVPKPPAAEALFDPELTTDLPPDEALEPPSLSGLSQFDVLGELGRGGMGVVYKARHRPLNRIVALKMVQDGKHTRSEYRERFRIEAEAVARLRHPNIIQVYHFGEADGCLFVTLELLEGGSLADRLRGTTQPGQAAAELVETLAGAMHVAHQAGIVHRDLKPSNVVFDREGTPKITDFGLAKRLEVEEGQTHTGQVMGTPSYMSPEQARGEIHKIGPPADIYALGAILYEALTGRPPFKGPNAVSTIRQVVYDDVVPPSRIEKRVARDLETICLKCLQKESSKRYGTALELADDLRRYLDNRPIRARRTPLLEQGAKWVRRHPALAMLLALATAAILFRVVLDVRAGVAHRAWVLEDTRKLEARRADGERRLDQAEARLLEDDWVGGRFLLEKLVPDLKDEPRLDPLQGRAQRLLDQANQKLVDTDEQRRAQQRLRDFIARRNEAFLHETRVTVLDMPADVRATRAAAHAALAVFAAPGPGDTWIFTPLPRALTPQEEAEIADGRYALLLVLAEAVAEALPGEDPVVQSDRGLRLLDQASGLRAQPTPAWHRARATCLVRKGDAAGAGRARDAADRLQPATVLDHYLAGRAAYRRRDWKPALEELETVLRMQPGHFWALCLSAIVALQSNQPGTAKLGLSACIEQQPELAALHLLRGIAAHQAAVQARVAGKTLKIEDGSIEAAVELQFDAAEIDYRNALGLLSKQVNDELRYTVLVDRAVMRFQRGRLDEAVADLEEAIRLGGRYYNAYASLAQVLQRQKKWDLAVARFTQAIELRPAWAPLYRARAAVALERDDQTPAHRAAALRDLEAAIRYAMPGDPLLAGDHVLRGELLRRDRRYDAALTACDVALKLASDLDTAHRLRVQVLLDLDRSDEVIRSCDGALARGKPWPGIHEIRGLARANRGDYAGAIDDYSKALALRPGQPRLLTARGLAYLVSDAPKLALHDFDEALRHDPANGETHGGRSLALVHLGDHGAATAAAEESLRHDPPTARRTYNAARVYALAAVAAAADAGAKARLAASPVERYQDRAVELVKLALERTPAERRAAFWHDQVAADPALRPLQRRLRKLQPGGAGAANTPVAEGRNRDTIRTW